MIKKIIMALIATAFAFALSACNTGDSYVKSPSDSISECEG